MWYPHVVVVTWKETNFGNFFSYWFSPACSAFQSPYPPLIKAEIVLWLKFCTQFSLKIPWKAVALALRNVENYYLKSSAYYVHAMLKINGNATASVKKIWQTSALGSNVHSIHTQWRRTPHKTPHKARARPASTCSQFHLRAQLLTSRHDGGTDLHSLMTFEFFKVHLFLLFLSSTITSSPIIKTHIEPTAPVRDKTAFSIHHVRIYAKFE